MKKPRILLSFLFVIFFCSSSCARRNDKEPVIRFKTTAGNFDVKLYPKTTAHRDNFVKLVGSGFYNGVLFHRVIRDFMIQAGDPDSKNASKKTTLGSGDVTYTLPAEIVYPEYYHKKGALAAARQGDNTNPLRASSGAQFYIVKGHKFDDAALNALELANKHKYETKFVRFKTDSIAKSRNLKPGNEVLALSDSLLSVVKLFLQEHPVYKFTEQQRNDYKTIGGTPHLDGEYTVFGEVIKGIEIVSNISMVKVGKLDRPLEDVRVLSAKRIR